MRAAPKNDKVGGGYLILARRVLESDMMDAPPLHWKLWIWMLGQANWKDCGGLKRGQFFTSINEMREAMSHRVGYRVERPSKDQIRSAYEAFTKATMITTTKTTRGMVITILNFNKYQDPKNYEAHNEPHDEIPTNPEATPHYTRRRVRKKKEEDSSLRSESPDNSASAEPPEAKQFPPEYHEFVEGFAAYVAQEHGAKAPKITPALISSSLDTVEKLVRIDGHSFETVQAAMRWAVRDGFWSKNALSLAGLRKRSDGLTKFQKILARFEEEKAPTPRPGGSGQRPGETPLAAIARARRERQEAQEAAANA